MDRPTFKGTTIEQFKNHMSMVFNNMLSVATNWRNDDDRTCLSGYIPTQSATGFIIAVRESDDTPPEILEKARSLHEAIQEFYASQN